MKSEPGPPATLGSVAISGTRIIVWCQGCGHQAEPNAAEMAQRYGVNTFVLEWRERLVCSKCCGREIDMVLTGSRR